MDTLGKDIRTVASGITVVGDSAEVYAVKSGKVKCLKVKEFFVKLSLYPVKLTQINSAHNRRSQRSKRNKAAVIHQ